MDLILYRVGSGIARITLNRPEKRNALNAEAIAGLADALTRSAQDAAVRVVVIAGAGKDFCAGFDVLSLDKGNEAGAVEHLETARRLADVLLAIRRHPHPVVAAVQGRALGGGAGIATACDLILATESAGLGYPEVKIGFVPAMVAALLRRAVTEKRMFELLASGEPVAAQEAKSIGLINQVFADAEFATGVEAYVQNLAAKSASALSMTKQLLYHTDGMTLEKAIEAGVQMNALSRTTEDAKRGFAGFGKKR
ncbi:MAG: enoyl-CoA hydratase/isomerase family protein [Acidobacteriota bacterium]|nr:enoyl-CoA hydratase/isomerase family protein [Acidobacteriota bacterium]